MNRLEFEELVFKLFGVKADYPFENDFETGVFRHTDNKKWFAIAMHIKKSRLGFSDDGYIDIVNLKCGEEIVASLLNERGIFPAYHMNKANWLSVVLDSGADLETVEFLLNVSYELTKSKKRK